VSFSTFKEIMNNANCVLFLQAIIQYEQCRLSVVSSGNNPNGILEYKKFREKG
jgi:MFS-type transporter involved in bile tolerance (Atg22 family)